MKLFSKLFSDKSSLIVTINYLVISVIFIVIAFIIGISDNPPGILFIYLGSITFIIAFSHNWKGSKKFKYLAVASITGFVVFVILHNLFDGLSKMFSANSLLQYLMIGISVVSFIAAVLICPAGLIVGAWGWISKKKIKDG